LEEQEKKKYELKPSMRSITENLAKNNAPFDYLEEGFSPGAKKRQIKEFQV